MNVQDSVPNISIHNQEVIVYQTVHVVMENSLRYHRCVLMSCETVVVLG